MTTIQPRGIRNNNPLNIKQGQRWQGLASEQTDPVFAKFKSMEYGIRAAFVLLRTYSKKYRCRTVSEIIRRWCPDGTEFSYIRDVCQRCGLKPTDSVDLSNRYQSAGFLRAMAIHECGQPLPMHLFENAWGMAFGKNNPEAKAEDTTPKI